MELLFSLFHENATEVGLTGGKGHGLAWLQRNGFQVPQALIFSAHAFENYLKYNGLLEGFNALKAEASLNDPGAENILAAAEKLRGKILQGRFSPRILRELENKIFRGPRFQNANLAIRSSVLDEDGGRHSFAGQMESVLNVRGRGDILRALRQCMAGAFGERVIRYRLQRHLPLNVQMAVVIQEIVVPEVSGVAMALDVASGRRDVVSISSNYGFGDGVVGGECDCDEFKVSEEKITFQNIANKEKMSDGRGYVDVPEKMRHKLSLQEKQVMDVAWSVRHISLAKGCPQDVEWAWNREGLWILQARPVTHFTPDERAHQRCVFDNSNIQESYCGVTTPLTFSFASDAYFKVYSQLMRLMGFGEREIAKHGRRHRHMLALLNGRVYYNLHSWYEGLLLLPSFGRNKADLEQMMGVTRPVEFVRDQNLSFAEKLHRLPGMIWLAVKLAARFSRIKKSVSRFEAWFAREESQINRGSFQFLGAQGLVEKITEVKETFLENWGIPILNDFNVMMKNGAVRRKLKKLGCEEEMPALMTAESIISVEPTRRLLGLAAKVRGRQNLREIFENSDPRNFLEKIQCLDKNLHLEFLDYIKKFGDRCVGELKLESVSLKEDPAFLHTVIRGYLAKPDLTPENFDRRQREEKQRAEEKVFGKLRSSGPLGFISSLVLRRQLTGLRDAVRYRESMRLARTRVFGLFRSLYLELGNRFVQFELLTSSKDIFYFTEEEIDGFVMAVSPQRGLKELVRVRRNEYAEYEKIESPDRLEMAFPLNENLEMAATQANPGNSFQGIGCFPGQVHSAVKLVKVPDAKLDLTGKILCTVRTDPGWTPLFASIEGLIVERGSTLSHSAVVAREMGIPAIVGVGEITKRLRDGEMVTMDGASGVLTRDDGNANSGGIHGSLG